jgi:hypothetical protein
MEARQERNLRYAQEMIGGTVREIRHQAESNGTLTQEHVERDEMQRDAFRTLVGQSVDAYTDLMHAPLAYYRQGLRLVESEGNGFQIGDRLDGMSAAEIREYEKRNENRETLIEQFDRKLRAASA